MFFIQTGRLSIVVQDFFIWILIQCLCKVLLWPILLVLSIDWFWKTHLSGAMSNPNWELCLTILSFSQYYCSHSTKLMNLFTSTQWWVLLLWKCTGFARARWKYISAWSSYLLCFTLSGLFSLPQQGLVNITSQGILSSEMGNNVPNYCHSLCFMRISQLAVFMYGSDMVIDFEYFVSCVCSFSTTAYWW